MSPPSSPNSLPPISRRPFFRLAGWALVLITFLLLVNSSIENEVLLVAIYLPKQGNGNHSGSILSGNSQIINARQPNTTYDMMSYIRRDKLGRMRPCNKSDPEAGLRLQNSHRSQCITHQGNRAFMGGCMGPTVARFCMGALHGVQTVDGLCLSAEVPAQQQFSSASISFAPCEWDRPRWVPGGILDMQLVQRVGKNSNATSLEKSRKPLCLDVYHSRRDARVIQWACKGRHNYKPTNQLWYWI